MRILFFLFIYLHKTNIYHHNNSNKILLYLKLSKILLKKIIINDIFIKKIFILKFIS